METSGGEIAPGPRFRPGLKLKLPLHRKAGAWWRYCWCWLLLWQQWFWFVARIPPKAGVGHCQAAACRSKPIASPYRVLERSIASKAQLSGQRSTSTRIASSTIGWQPSLSGHNLSSTPAWSPAQPSPRSFLGTRGTRPETHLQSLAEVLSADMC